MFLRCIGWCQGYKYSCAGFCGDLQCGHGFVGDTVRVADAAYLTCLIRMGKDNGTDFSIKGYRNDCLLFLGRCYFTVSQQVGYGNMSLHAQWQDFVSRLPGTKMQGFGNLFLIEPQAARFSECSLIRRTGNRYPGLVPGSNAAWSFFSIAVFSDSLPTRLTAD